MNTKLYADYSHIFNGYVIYQEDGGVTRKQRSNAIKKKEDAEKIVKKWNDDLTAGLIPDFDFI